MFLGLCKAGYWHSTARTASAAVSQARTNTRQTCLDQDCVEHVARAGRLPRLTSPTCDCRVKSTRNVLPPEAPARRNCRNSRLTGAPGEGTVVRRGTPCLPEPRFTVQIGAVREEDRRAQCLLPSSARSRVRQGGGWPQTHRDEPAKLFWRASKDARPRSRTARARSVAASKN